MRPARGGDPFATARLFGVETPDPASAAGLFSAGPKSSDLNTPGPATPPGFGRATTGSRGPGVPDPSNPSADSPPGKDSAPDADAGTKDIGGVRNIGGVRLPAERVTPLTGELPVVKDKPSANPMVSTDDVVGSASNGFAPAAWNDPLPMGRTTRDAANGLYTPADPSAPMIGNLDYVSADSEPPPIFESVSVWFSDQTGGLPLLPRTTESDEQGQGPLHSPVPGADVPAEPNTSEPNTSEKTPDAEVRQAGDTLALTDSPAAEPAKKAKNRPASSPAQTRVPAAASSGAAVAAGRSSTPPDAPRLIDLRDSPLDGSAAVGAGASRWSSLGDQQWLATSARAAAAPQVAGDTSAGLPRRKPGANLLPSAASAAPGAPSAAAVFPRADADSVRGRLGSFQRGVSSARRSRRLSTGGRAAGLFTTSRTAETEHGREPDEDEQGGEP